jgi:hypothetical protein
MKATDLILSVLVLGHTAFASGGVTGTCVVVGSLEAIPDVDASAVCARFEREFVSLIRESGVAGSLSIELAFHKRGSIEAVIRLTKCGNTTHYPTISVNTLDRVIRLSDLDVLAQAAALALTNEALLSRGLAQHQITKDCI